MCCVRMGGQPGSLGGPVRVRGGAPPVRRRGLTRSVCAQCAVFFQLYYTSRCALLQPVVRALSHTQATGGVTRHVQCTHSSHETTDSQRQRQRQRQAVTHTHTLLCAPLRA